MEDKHVQEALAVIRMSPENPFLKDKKKLIKLKLELAKALIEAGHDIH